MISGKTYPFTPSSIKILVLVLDNLGEYEEEEKIYSQALALKERLLRKEHPDTLTSTNGLARVFQKWNMEKNCQAIAGNSKP